MAFWQWWSGWFVILICTFTTLKILPCPPMFIWTTFVQLQYPAGLLSSQRWGGPLPRSRTCKTMQVPHFTCFHTNSSCIRCAWVHRKGAPSSPVFIPNIVHSLSLFTDLHPHSPEAWPSVVTTFSFSTLHTISPCLKFTSTTGSEISDETLNL